MMDRPSQDAPRLAWLLYVYERVAPILASHDAEFAELVQNNEELVSIIRLEVESPEVIPENLRETTLAPIAHLVAQAQAAFDVIAYTGTGNKALMDAAEAAFAPHSLWVGPIGSSRWWWDHGAAVPEVCPDPRQRPHFAPPTGSMCEAIYQEERNRRLMPPETLEEARRDSLSDTADIQRAAGIGLFQSSPEDSESAESDTDGIRDAAGIGLFQTAVPRIRKTSDYSDLIDYCLKAPAQSTE